MSVTSAYPFSHSQHYTEMTSGSFIGPVVLYKLYDLNEQEPWREMKACVINQTYACSRLTSRWPHSFSFHLNIMYRQQKNFGHHSLSYILQLICHYKIFIIDITQYIQFLKQIQKICFVAVSLFMHDFCHIWMHINYQIFMGNPHI